MCKIKILICLMLSAAIFLTACADNKTEQEQLVESFVSSFKSKDFEKMYELTNDKYRYLDGMYDENSSNSVLMFDKIIKNLDFEITKVETSGETANVYTHISTVNMYKVIEEISKSADAASNPNIVEDTIDKYSDELWEDDTVFNLIKQDDKWVIESNITIYSDLTGGYLQYIYEISIFGGMAGEQVKQ